MRQNLRNSIVYRLRNAGYRIDTRGKLIYKADLGRRNLVDRLKNEYGYAETTELFESDVKARVYLAYVGNLNDEDYDMWRRNGYVIMPQSRDAEKMAYGVIRSQIVYFGVGWEKHETIWLLELAKALGRTILFGK